MTIKEWCKAAHENALNKGFYDQTNGILIAMKHSHGPTSPFTAISDRSVKDAFTAQRLMLITSELGEALEANRKDRRYIEDNSGWAMDIVSTDDEAFQNWFRSRVKDTFEDELADTVIRIFDLCGWLDIDLERHIELKAKYNATREKMHGDKAY